jgi:geranylgeranyl pyrophosphate synthase
VPGRELALDAAALRAMHLQKTGALIRASAVSGALLAGAPPHLTEAVGRWASEVGLAFQIVDDILDVEGSAAELGKTAGKDAAQSKPTYPALFGMDHSRSMAAACADRARAILAAVELHDTWLNPIADWIITRKN